MTLYSKDDDVIINGSETMEQSLPYDPMITLMTDLSQIFYKITNVTENHHGFQYKDGLNVLGEPFNSDPIDYCSRGGLYFSDAKHVLKFVNFGYHLREITSPFTDPDFKIVKDPAGNKLRANKIIPGKKYQLRSIDTFEIAYGKRN